MEENAHVHPFVRIMQRYIEDYCNRHDPSVCGEIMAPDYVVHIGGRHLVGRDDQYVPAASAAFANYPDLRLTVHEVHTNGDRLVMRFTERGTNRETGRVAAWGGIGLYDWDGSVLVSNWVEQDYAARRRQVDGQSGPDPVEAAHPDPWSAEPVPADPSVEAVARRFLAGLDLLAAHSVVVDDSWITGRASLPFEPGQLRIDDLFSIGAVVAAHVVMSAGSVELNLALLARVEDDEVVSLRGVTNRLSLAD